MAALAPDLLRHFWLLLWNRWTEFNKTWQEARSQCPLQSLCFSGTSENQDGCPGVWLAETFSTSSMTLLNGFQRNIDRKQYLNIFCQVNVFQPDEKIKIAALSDLLKRWHIVLRCKICGPLGLLLCPQNGIRGHLVFVLSVCDSVAKNFNLGHNFWTIRDIDFIFGMHTQLMKPWAFKWHQGQWPCVLDCDLYTKNSHFGLFHKHTRFIIGSFILYRDLLLLLTTPLSSVVLWQLSLINYIYLDYFKVMRWKDHFELNSITSPSVRGCYVDKKFEHWL